VISVGSFNFILTLYVYSLCSYLFLGLMITVQGQQQLVKTQLICAVMDLPAKAALLNVMQYNGENGCASCTHPGTSVINCVKIIHCYANCCICIGISWKRYSLCLSISL